MIPFFHQPSISFGPITIHAFGVVTALAVAVGLWLARRRAVGAGLDPDVNEGLAWYALVFGFVGAHLYSVLLYFPEKLLEDPLLLFRIWEDISSTGGILGGALGIWVYFRRHRTLLDPPRRRRHLDAVAYALPFAWAVGRFACTLAHDHPGRVTTFPLARSLETEEAREFVTAVYAGAGRLSDLPPPEAQSRIGFHDLGWYEFLYLVLVAIPVFLHLDRKPRPPGFWAVAFVAVYAPVRFFLDFLRVADPTYAGLTPAQWAILLVLLGGVGWVASGRSFLATPKAGAPPSEDSAAANLDPMV